MRRLEDALRDLAEQDDRIDTGELIARIEQRLGHSTSEASTAPGAPVASARRRSLIVAAAFLTPLLLIGGVSLLLRAPEGADTVSVETSRVAPTTFAPTTAPPQTTMPTVVPDNVELSPDSPSTAPPTTVAFTAPGPEKGFNRGSIIRHLAVTDDLVVAVGSACEGSEGQGQCVGTVWTSLDAATWTRIKYDATLFGEPTWRTRNFGLTDVAATGAGFVAVGTGVPTLFSEDGIEWNVVDGLEDARLQHVVGGEPGFAAAGNGIWLSEDGRTWHPLEGPQPTSVSHLAIGPDGLVVLAGSAVWTSAAGGTWESLERHAGAEPSQPSSACLGGPRPKEVGRLLGNADGLLVTEESLWVEGPAALWTSDDGVVWNYVELPPAGYENAKVTAVAVGEDDYLAFGLTWYLPNGASGGCPSVTSTSVTWRSSDARTWTLMDSRDGDSAGRDEPTDAWFYGDKVLLVIEGRTRVVSWTPPDK